MQQFELNPALTGGCADATLKSTKPQVIVVAADTIAMAEFVRKVRTIDKGVNIVGLSTVNHRTLLELAKADLRPAP